MPDTNDLLAQLATASLDDLAGMLETEEGRLALASLFGEEQVQALWAEARALSAVRAGGSPLNLVILPGLMGSLLKNTLGTQDLLWINPLAILKGMINLLELAPDGLSDADPQVHIIAIAVELVVYTRLRLAARRVGRAYPFPYDWRRDIRQTAAALKKHVDRWADGDPARKFILLGHSMGGLVALAYLARFPAHAEQRVERLVMMGSPLRGSVEAVLSLAHGNSLMELLARLNTGNDTLRMVRSLPGLYQLLPPPRELFPARFVYPVDFDLYQAGAWPVTGVSPGHLAGARELHELLATSDPQVPLAQIAGYDVPTHVSARVENGKLIPTLVSGGPSGGDGTVPLWSSTLLRGDTYFLPAEHMKLPREQAVIEAVLALARGGVPDLDTAVPTTRGPGAAVTSSIDVEAEAARLRAAIEAGKITADDLEKLFFIV